MKPLLIASIIFSSFSTLVVADIKLSSSEKMAFARSCYNFVSEDVRESRRPLVLELSSRAFIRREKYDDYYEVQYILKEFLGSKLKYSDPRLIKTSNRGAYFETTIFASIKQNYTGDGWTLKDKTENIERAYTCLSVSVSRSEVPKVVAMHHITNNDDHWFSDVNGDYLETFELEERYSYPQCMVHCGSLKSFIVKHDSA